MSAMCFCHFEVRPPEPQASESMSPTMTGAVLYGVVQVQIQVEQGA